MSSVYSDTIYQPSTCVDGVPPNPASSLNICLSGVGMPDPWLAV